MNLDYLTESILSGKSSGDRHHVWYMSLSLCNKYFCVFVNTLRLLLVPFDLIYFLFFFLLLASSGFPVDVHERFESFI
jgi:hypothetical protein